MCTLAPPSPAKSTRFKCVPAGHNCDVLPRLRVARCIALVVPLTTSHPPYPTCWCFAAPPTLLYFFFLHPCIA